MGGNTGLYPRVEPWGGRGVTRGAEGGRQAEGPAPRPRAATPRRRRVRWGRVVLLACVFLLLFAAGFGGAYVVSAVRGLPPLSAADANPVQTSFIYDLQGQLVEPVP